jgi:hypothetical protein
MLLCRYGSQSKPVCLWRLGMVRQRGILGAVNGKNKMLQVAIATLIVIGIMLYLYRSAPAGLDVEPHAREEIEKAKRR